MITRETWRAWRRLYESDVVFLREVVIEMHGIEGADPSWQPGAKRLADAIEGLLPSDGCRQPE